MKNRSLVGYLTVATALCLALGGTFDVVAARGPDEEVLLGVEAPGLVDATIGAVKEATSEEALTIAVVEHSRNPNRYGQQNDGSFLADSTDLDVDDDGVLDLAVIQDNGSIIVPERPTNSLDLQPGMRIRYTPVGVDSFHVELAEGQSLDPAFGPNLGLGDDDYTTVPFPGAFPFLGATYANIFVGSDGHVTLVTGDGSSSVRDAARHVGGPPRLSALLTDLNPTCGGSVHADVRSDRVVVTWNGVVHFRRGAASGCTGVPTNTVQAVLYTSGMVDFIYGELDAEWIGQEAEAVTGIAEGASEGPLNEIDMTEDLPQELAAGAIFEEYSPGTPKTFDLVELSLEFYRTHEDKYDYLVLFTDFDVFARGTAFSFGVTNQTLGLRRSVFDNSGLVGSDGELENILWMNNIDLWVGNSVDDYTNPQIHEFAVTTSPSLTSRLGGEVTPNTSPYELVGMLDITGPGNSTGYTHHGRALFHENPHTRYGASQGALRYGLNSAMSIMYQEAAHRWAAFPVFLHPTEGLSGAAPFDLLGRDLSHWSAFFNTRVDDSPFAGADGMPRFSGMEGNAIIQLALADGAVVDMNDPGRVISDPNGELTEAIASCTAQGKSAFLTEPDELIDGSTQLDQYLMGVRLADDVSPFWYVDEPSSPLDARSLDDFPTNFIRGSTFNVDDIAFCGTRVDLTVDDITVVGSILGSPILGPRVPAIGDENDVGPVEACHAENLGGTLGPCVDVKTMAFILLVESGPPEAHMPAIDRMNEFRRAWQAYTDGPGLGGRNADGAVRPQNDPNFIPKFDTSLEPAIH